MTDFSIALPLDPKEQHFRIPSPIEGLSLFLRYLPAAERSAARPVLYVHGGTFPSALSIAHRFDGRSWRDELSEAGFHVWGLDFHGLGNSDPHPRLSRFAHSWGTMVAVHLAGRCPDLIDRMVFFGPIARRDPVADRQNLP